MAFKFVIALAFLAVASAGLVPAAPVAVLARNVEEYDPHPQYQFGYDVQDSLSGDFKNQIETRDGDLVQGEYSLNDADGFRRTVKYTADSINGFNAVVSREPLVNAVVAAPVVKAAPALLKAAPVAYAAPALVKAAPLAYSSPVAYSSPALVRSAPLAYSSPVAYPTPALVRAAPLAYSSPVAYSSPALVRSAPLAYSSPVAYSSPALVRAAPLAYSSPVAYASQSLVKAAPLAYAF